MMQNTLCKLFQAY